MQRYKELDLIYYFTAGEKEASRNLAIVSYFGKIAKAVLRLPCLQTGALLDSVARLVGAPSCGRDPLRLRARFYQSGGNRRCSPPSGRSRAVWVVQIIKLLSPTV